MYSLFPVTIIGRMTAPAHFLHAGKIDPPLTDGPQGIPIFGIMAVQAAKPAVLKRDLSMLFQSRLIISAFCRKILMAVLARESFRILLPHGKLKRQ
jgi:hypothetical protein